VINRTLKFISSFLFTHAIEERKSEVSGKIEVLYSNGKYVLDAANANYSFGGAHTVLRRAFSQFRVKQREIKKVLVLGFGCGSVASILQEEYRKKVEMVGVEKDKEVIELAKKYFSIDKYKSLSLHCADAYDFVLNAPPSAFDLIVLDIFVDLIVPEQFQEEKFLSALGKLVLPGGILFYNFIVRDEKTRDKGAQLYKRMNNLIGHTEWVRIFAKRSENWVFVSDKTKKQE
jgi:spermidine synthase